MSQKRRRRRRNRRARKILRLIKIVTVLVLTLAFAGTGAWLLWESRPEISVTTYPVKYEDMIRRYSAEYNLNPAYVASVILAESGYDPNAVSKVNAQGLMQVMPGTGKWVAGKFSETYTEGCLFDPETNIKYGCWLLSWLLDRYDGDVKCASSAYHQGQQTVDDWLENPAYSRDGKTLDQIPSDLTNTYVNRILKYCEKYEEIYG